MDRTPPAAMQHGKPALSRKSSSDHSQKQRKARSHLSVSYRLRPWRARKAATGPHEHKAVTLPARISTQQRLPMLELIGTVVDWCEPRDTVASFDQFFRLFHPLVTLDTPGKTNHFAFKALNIACVQLRQVKQCVDAAFFQLLFKSRADALDLL